MVALYGSKNGFGWKLNETIGAQIISVPMSNADAKIWKSFMLFVAITSAIFLCLLVLLDIMLRKLVILPVRSHGFDRGKGQHGGCIDSGV